MNKFEWGILKILWLTQVLTEKETRLTAGKWRKYLDELDFKDDYRRG
jgi:hypothetical protein